jgi:hypothetical protein
MARSITSTSTLLATASLFCVAGALGCGDNRASLTNSTASDADPALACPSDSGPIDPTMLIDDFEHASPNLPLIAGRLGGWYSAGDATTGAIMQPLGAAPPELIPGGRCGNSHKALHITGSGFLDWGSEVSATMSYGPNSSGVSEERPYDAAARGYQGVRFFARVGDTSTTTVRFVVSDEYARPEAGLCIVPGAQGTACYDTYGVMLTAALTTDWREFHIPWSGLAQQNFGLPGGLGPDTSKIYDIGFSFPARVVFDLWVDDMTFY